MYRKIIIMCVTLAILAILSAVEQIAVRRITDEALSNTKTIIADIRGKQLLQAAQKAKALDEQWDRRARWLEMMVDHGSTDDVRYAFSRLIAALEEEDSATAMVYACELEGSIEHVYERQALTAENIL